jgi:hypothetical protein
MRTRRLLLALAPALIPASATAAAVMDCIAKDFSGDRIGAIAA